MKVFEESKGFPKEERYFLTDQIRRSSRSVAANVAESYRRRRYRAMFISRIIDADFLYTHGLEKFQDELRGVR